MDKIKLNFKKTRSKYTFMSFIWTLWGAYKFRQDLSGFINSEWRASGNFCDRLPEASINLRRKYKIEAGSDESIVFALLEEYFKKRST